MTRAERVAIHELLVRFEDGDRSAFDPLFAAPWPVVRAFVGRSLPGPDAEDAAQEARVKVFARVADFDPRRDATAWALTIASFEVLTARRRRARRREDPGELDAVAWARTLDDDIHTRELLAHLVEYLGTVSESDRAAIAAELGAEAATGETARKRRWRALERLRRYWRAIHE